MRGTTVVFLLCGIFYLASSEDVLKKGDSYFYQGNNEAALTMYEYAYRDKPHTYDVLVRLVQVHADNGYSAFSRQPTLAEAEYQKAAQYADTLLQYFPEFSETHVLMALAKGSLLPFKGLTERIRTAREVLQHIEKALALDSLVMYAWLLRGIFERELSQISWIERTVVKLVFGANLKGSLSSAENFLWRAQRLDPKSIVVYYELYQTYKIMGKNDTARSMLETLLLLQPKTLRERIVYRTATELLRNFKTK